MYWMLDDRRSRRSEDRAVALRYQLEHARERGGLEALVLADAQGLLLSCAGDPGVCEELAAFAPLLSRTVLGMPLPPLLRGADVDVRPMSLNGQALFLACVGGGMARDALISHSLQGVHRILATN